MNQKRKETKAVSKEELASFREAVVAKFGTSLKPGETLLSHAIRTEEESIFSLIIEQSDKSFRLEIEAVLLEKGNEKITPDNRLFLAVDFVDDQLSLFFEEPMTRFHDDWRVYDYRNAEVRFRGQKTNPELESLAEQWLDGSMKNEEE